MDINDIIVFALFALILATIVVAEIRSTKRINTYVREQNARKRHYLDMLAEMYLECMRKDPQLMASETDHMRNVIEYVTGKHP